jgi:DNA-binding CsgD family transcriptional regulator
MGIIDLVLVEMPSIPNFRKLRHFGLTERECEAIHWLALGKRDLEIASIMGAAPKTVSKHVENTLRKLGASNRTTAVRAAVRCLQVLPV